MAKTIFKADIPAEELNEWGYPNKEIWVFKGFCNASRRTMWSKL